MSTDVVHYSEVKNRIKTTGLNHLSTHPNSELKHTTDSQNLASIVF